LANHNLLSEPVLVKDFYNQTHPKKKIINYIKKSNHISKRYKHKNCMHNQQISASHNELITMTINRKLTSSTPFGNNDINAAFAAACSALFNVEKYSRLSKVCPFTVTLHLKRLA
jgi:hypothetical protein